MHFRRQIERTLCINQMSNGCQEIEVYNFMTNATIVLDICNSGPYAHYLSAGLVSVAFFMMFVSCCLFTAWGALVHKPLSDRQSVPSCPPSYESV
jgi:hypothetical protein